MSSLLMKLIETIIFMIVCLFLLWFGAISNDNLILNYSLFGIIILVILYTLHMSAMAKKEVKEIKEQKKKKIGEK